MESAGPGKGKRPALPLPAAGYPLGEVKVTEKRCEARPHAYREAACPAALFSTALWFRASVGTTERQDSGEAELCNSFRSAQPDDRIPPAFRQSESDSVPEPLFGQSFVAELLPAAVRCTG